MDLQIAKGAQNAVVNQTAKAKTEKLISIIAEIKKLFVLCNRQASEETIALISEALNDDGYDIGMVKYAVGALSRKTCSVLGLPQIIAAIQDRQEELEKERQEAQYKAWIEEQRRIEASMERVSPEQMRQDWQLLKQRIAAKTL